MASEISDVALQTFTPFTLRSTTFRNRLVVSPMCQYSSEDGLLNDWHLVHYGSRAVGGYGLVIIEATGVTPEGRITPGDSGLWKDEQIAPLKKVVDFVKSHGAVAGIQLGHAGRKGSAAAPWKGDHHLKDEEGGWQTVAPSAIAFDDHHLWKVPRELTLEEIHQIEESFVAAAKRAVAAGVQLIEIHGAHGYLIHEFLSPLSNKRTDAYGGSFENRTRFLKEVVRKVRAAIPEEIVLFVRLSTTDWHAEGWTIEDSAQLSGTLKDLGVDLIDASSAFLIPNFQDIPFGPGFQVPLAEKIKKDAEIATGAVGFLFEPEQAEEILKEGKADLVLQARESLRDTYFPVHAAKKLGVEKPNSLFPVQYSHWLNRH